MLTTSSSLHNRRGLQRSCRSTCNRQNNPRTIGAFHQPMDPNSWHSVPLRRQVEDQSKAKVFISYSRKDISFADRLEAALKSRGFEPLIDRTEIYAFEEWWKRIEALIARADTVVFVLSPDAVASDVALKEVSFAASLNNASRQSYSVLWRTNLYRRRSRSSISFSSMMRRGSSRAQIGLPKRSTPIFPGSGSTPSLVSRRGVGL